jgi:hypothetical protein
MNAALAFLNGVGHDRHGSTSGTHSDRGFSLMKTALEPKP